MKFVTFPELKAREHTIAIQVNLAVEIFILLTLLFIVIEHHGHHVLEDSFTKRIHSE